MSTRESLEHDAQLEMAIEALEAEQEPRTHLPDCTQAPVVCSDGSVRRATDDPCICARLRAAYRRGYNDHARSGALAYEMYGICANQHGAGTNP